jgi:hypothetical protein
MTFDERLATRIRSRLGKRAGLTEKKMFGGLAFLIRGNMCCGVHGDEMIVRLAAEETDAALAKPGARIFDLSGGRPMKGWILVGGTALASDASLGKWIDIAAAYAEALPARQATGKR